MSLKKEGMQKSVFEMLFLPVLPFETMRKSL